MRDWSSDVCSSDLALTVGHDPFDPLLRRVEPRLALLAQHFAPLIQRNRFVERNRPAFEALHDLLTRGARLFAAELRIFPVPAAGLSPFACSSEARRVGQACVSTCRPRGAPH